MNRPLALVCAILVAFITVSSACMAQSPDWIRFTLEPQRDNSGRIDARFEHRNERGSDNNWSSGFMPSDLIGLEVSSFHAPGSRPLHFAVVREAGRLDCSGNGGHDIANGTCRFIENAGFAQLLVSRGIARPTREQAFGMMAVNVRRELIDAVAAAHYPTPTIENLMALSAVGVDGRYIADMARAGYRPRTLQSLVEFRAVGITPQWIAGFVRVGYANLPGDGLIQMRALGITPEYVEGFQRIGYRNLPVDTLVELKALDITPAFVRAVAGAGQPLPPVSHLVELRMFGKRH